MTKTKKRKGGCASEVIYDGCTTGAGLLPHLSLAIAPFELRSFLIPSSSFVHVDLDVVVVCLTRAFVTRIPRTRSGHNVTRPFHLTCCTSPEARLGRIWASHRPGFLSSTRAGSVAGRQRERGKGKEDRWEVVGLYLRHNCRAFVRLLLPVPEAAALGKGGFGKPEISVYKGERER